MTGRPLPVHTHIVAPAAWCSYLVNGDDSGLEPGERAKVDAWLEREGVRIVDVQRDPDGEPGEPYFCKALDLHAPEYGFSGGNALDYVAHETRLQLAESEGPAIQ